MTSEKLIRVDEPAIGSTLARDVRDGTGAIVCCAGDRLSWQMVRTLRCRDVDSVHVLRAPNRTGNQTVTERLAELDRKFAHIQDDPIMSALKDIIAERIREKSRGET
jgi:hypothetical protein